MNPNYTEFKFPQVRAQRSKRGVALLPESWSRSCSCSSPEPGLPPPTSLLSLTTLPFQAAPPAQLRARPPPSLHFTPLACPPPIHTLPDPGAPLGQGLLQAHARRRGGAGGCRLQGPGASAARAVTTLLPTAGGCCAGSEPPLLPPAVPPPARSPSCWCTRPRSAPPPWRPCGTPFSTSCATPPAACPTVRAARPRCGVGASTRVAAVAAVPSSARRRLVCSRPPDLPTPPCRAPA